MQFKTRLRERAVSRSILVASASAAALLSSASMAAIVTSPVANLALPETTAGVYINVITGATGASGGAVAGWDLNPYNMGAAAPGGPGFGIYWIPPQGGAPVRNAAVGDPVSGAYTILTPGATIGPNSAFSSAIAGASVLRPTGDRFIGFRFFNETTSAINYGYARFTNTAPNGFPATLVSVVYEDSGAAITIPLPAVAPQFSYTPATGSTVTATGGGAIGSTSALTITPAVGTAGAGTGAGATTTLTCTAPAAPFAGFGQTVTAVGTGAITGGPLSGTCTRGAAAATATLTCSENRGGTATPVTWSLSCPAGTASAPAAIPTLGWTGLWLAIFGVLGLGLFAARRRAA